MAEGIVSASQPPTIDDGSQARFDAELSTLLERDYQSDNGPLEYPPGMAPDGPDVEPDVVGGIDVPPPGTDAPGNEETVEGEGDGDEVEAPDPEPVDPAGGPTVLKPPADDAEPEQPEPQPAASASDQPPTDLNRIFEAYLGAVPTPDQTIELLNFVTELQQLPPEHQAVVERALHRDPSLLQQAVTPTPDPDDDDDLDLRDPHVTQLEARLAALESERQQSVADQRRQWQEYERDTTKSAAAHYGAERNMDANDLAILEAKAHQLGTYPAMLRSHNNDPGAAYIAALDMAYWNTPMFRDRELAQTPQTQAQDGADNDRKTLASAVSASSSSSAKPITRDQPKTLADAKAAAIAELAGVFEP